MLKAHRIFSSSRRRWSKIDTIAVGIPEEEFGARAAIWIVQGVPN